MIKPSSLRTWATFFFSLVAGISTAGRSIALALRIRVSMSAIGSVIISNAPYWTNRTHEFHESHQSHDSSPTRFPHTWDHAVAGHIPETNPANAELAIDRPGPAAQSTAISDADLLPRQHLRLLGVAPVRLELGHLLLELRRFRRGRHTFLVRKPLVQFSRNGMPNERRSSRASSSLRVLVTMVMSIPCVKLTLSGSTSGKINCSVTPIE